MQSCLFCRSDGPSTRPEHIIPQALGNDDLMLWGEVCDKCNQYFGAKVERFVLGKTPLGFWRTYLGIKGRRGKLPHVDLSQFRRQKGRYPAVHPHHDDGVGFTGHEDYSVSMDIDDPKIIRQILDGARRHLTFVFTPLVLVMMGRFFCKVGMELVCLDNPRRARSDMFAQARRFARFGAFDGLWPIFHFQSGSIEGLKESWCDAEGILEQVLCYRYRLFEIADRYTVLALTVGTDTWVVSLDDPYPTLVIRSAFPGKRLKCLWYGPRELGREVSCRGGPNGGE